MPFSSSPFERRQNPPPIGADDDTFDDDFWYSNDAYIAKWAAIGGIFLIFFIFLVAGYFHAQRRMKKGLPPLAYHRWLIPRRQRMQYDPTYQNRYMAYPMNNQQHGYATNGYAMNGYAPPPPVYDRNHENTPAYLPPQSASKVNPDQADYASIPPPGAPPPRNDEAPAYPSPIAGSSGREQT